MKEFSQWVSDMSGTIPDDSEFTKPTHNQESLTDLQKRLHIADLLVPSLGTEDKIDDWVTAFCVAFKDGYLYNTNFGLLVGSDIRNEYIATDGYSASNAWLNNFRQKILLGKLK